MIPALQAYPYLLVGSGSGRWEVGAQELIDAKYGRLGAAGMVFHVVYARKFVMADVVNVSSKSGRRM